MTNFSFSESKLKDLEPREFRSWDIQNSLTKTCSSCSSLAALVHCCVAATKAVLVEPGWCPGSTHESRHQWYVAQHILSPVIVLAGEVRAASSIVEHGSFIALYDSVRGQGEGFKHAEENQSRCEFLVLALAESESGDL